MRRINIEKNANSRADFENNGGIPLKSTRSNSHFNFNKSIKILAKSKCSQHETVGFVVIVSLVIIVGVIFLGIRMNQDSTPQQYKDADIMNFLVASSKYTSDCFENHEPLILNELKEKCYRNENEKCNSDGVTLCEVLNNIYSGMLNTSWLIYEDSPIKYYELNISYRAICNDSTTTRPITSPDFIIHAGNLSQCSFSNKRTGQESFPISGSGEECIVTELEICEKETK